MAEWMYEYSEKYGKNMLSKPACALLIAVISVISFFVISIFEEGGAFLLMGIAVVALIAGIPASIAEKKGYSALGFWLFGLCLFVPALVVALLIKDKNEPTVVIAAPANKAASELSASIKPSVPDGTYGAADELAKYKAFLDNGVITEEEFSIVKKRLLGL